MEMINAAVIGLGRLGCEHAKNTKEIPGLRLLAVCDHTLEKARRVAMRLDVLKYTDNVDAIMADKDIDAVIIVTQSSEHEEVILKAIAAEKAIFVEKPLAVNLQQSLYIQQEITKHKAFCQVGFMRRFDEDYIEAQRIIASGDIGTPLYFKGISRDPVAPNSQYIAQSGGLFVDMSIHDFDLARFLMKDEVTSVAAFGTTIKYPELAKHHDVDQGMCYIEFEKGAVGDIEGSRCAYYGYDIRTEVIGSEGSLFIGNSRKNHIDILTKRGNSHAIIPDFPTKFKTAFVNELTAFKQAIVTKNAPKVGVEDSIKALRIALAATESLRDYSKKKQVKK